MPSYHWDYAQPDTCTHQNSNAIPDFQPDAVTHAEPNAVTHAKPDAIAISPANSVSHVDPYALADDADAIDGPKRVAHRHAKLGAVRGPIDLTVNRADERCRLQHIAAVDFADAGTVRIAEPAPDDWAVGRAEPRPNIAAPHALSDHAQPYVAG